jgi:uncharacterized OB-fold protein
MAHRGRYESAGGKMMQPADAAQRRAPRAGRVLRSADVASAPDGRLHLCAAECAQCGTRIFPAAPVCPTCNAEQMRPLLLSGQGTLYAYSTVHVAPAAWETPYCIGYVDLPEGVRVFGKVEGAAGLKPDAMVQVRVEPLPDAAPGAAGSFQYWFAPI